ncbi:MAG: transcriptional regulator, IclR family, partial [Acidimicrobiaceae bacterium]|nr:transcriptional regulator, IclR family [Acidimicrobiaceae bacterium]
RETGLVRHTPHTITDEEALFVELDEVLRRGYAVDDEEDVEGVFCVGAPFFDHNGQCVGAISVTGIKHELRPARLAEMGRLLGDQADEVSKLLGGPSFAEAAARRVGPSSLGAVGATR